MARAVTNRIITPGGAVGWLDPASTIFNDPAIPTMTTVAIFYRVSGDAGPNPFYVDLDTTATPAAVRSACKDAIQADILATYGITIAKSAIRMSNSFE